MVWNGRVWTDGERSVADDFPLHPGDTVVAVVRTPRGFGRRVGKVVEIRRASERDAVPAVYMRRACGGIVVAQPKDIECAATPDGDDVPVSAIIAWQRRIRGPLHN